MTFGYDKNSFDGTPIADLTYGFWADSPSQRITIENARLPFILQKSDIPFAPNYYDWITLQIALKSEFSEAKIVVECGDTSDSSSASAYESGNNVVMEGDYQWHGNGSLLSYKFRDSVDIQASDSLVDMGWPYGAFVDVAGVHPSNHKPAVYFQWQVWDEVGGCSEIYIDSPDLPSGTGIQVNAKAWDQTTATSIYTGTLGSPITVSASDSLITDLSHKTGGKWWVLVEVKLTNTLSQSGSIVAYCPGFDGYN